MSDHITTKNSDLFIGISEKEQESVSGGGSSLPFEMVHIFFDHTNIYTRGISDLDISEGNFRGISRNETEYQFSRTTFVLASFFGGGSGQFNNQIQGSGLLYRILNFL